jgi:hypothetical protein
MRSKPGRITTPLSELNLRLAESKNLGTIQTFRKTKGLPLLRFAAAKRPARGKADYFTKSVMGASKLLPAIVGNLAARTNFVDSLKRTA